MKKSTIAALVVTGVIVIGGFSAVGNYNNLTTSEEQVDKQWSNVDTQLQRRADLIPNLVNTVKGITGHEEKVFTELANARNAYQTAKTPEQKINANNQLETSLRGMLVLQESYPELKSSQSFQQLADELAGTENRITVARKDYNEAVGEYNTKIKKFPNNLMPGFDEKDYFKADASAKNTPNVNFGGKN